MTIRTKIVSCKLCDAEIKVTQQNSTSLMESDGIYFDFAGHCWICKSCWEKIIVEVKDKMKEEKE
jgi:hypothetical protein